MGRIHKRRENGEIPGSLGHQGSCVLALQGWGNLQGHDEVQTVTLVVGG